MTKQFAVVAAVHKGGRPDNRLEGHAWVPQHLQQLQLRQMLQEIARQACRPSAQHLLRQQLPSNSADGRAPCSALWQQLHSSSAWSAWGRLDCPGMRCGTSPPREIPLARPGLSGLALSPCAVIDNYHGHSPIKATK